MCGIVGIWNINGSEINKTELDRFTDSLKHRGPDGRGTYIDKKASLGLGHRRLSILDLTDSGHQPMSYGDGKYWITYNGEIYNFLELRAELEGLGHRFRSESDTEIILSAYAQWGEACQFRFNGMWSFAIWDTKERSLFLSRDRFGIKPLFYKYDGNHFIFASELKAFMSLGKSLQPDFDKGMLSLIANIESAQKTILKGVNNLNGGHQLFIGQNKSPLIKRWWKTSDHLISNIGSFEDQVAHYKDIFSDSCRIRMRSDVPIGTALSGGLDSSAILCTMNHIRSTGSDNRRIADDWQKAFVLDYSDTTYSERSFAEKVIKYTNTKPYYKEIPLSNISVDDIIESTYAFEAVMEPAIGPWYIYKEMRKNGVVVSMDGHGGDELLAGYNYYPEIALRDSLWPWQNIERYKDIIEIFESMQKEDIRYESYSKSLPSRFDLMKMMIFSPEEIKSKIKKIVKSNRQLYRIIYHLNSKLRSHNSINEKFNRNISLPRDPVYIKHDKLPSTFDNLNTKLYSDFHIAPLPVHLRDFDRLSMAHGVEVRTPFMDWRLVTYVFSLPSDSKLGSGFTKRILRESMQNILPEEIRLRKGKIGFASPLGEWYKHSLKNFVLDSVNSDEFLQSEIWNGNKIRDFVENCYKNSDYQRATKSWKYIQSMILVNSFKKKAYNN